MTGIIYCYTSPSGKKYIGQTRKESERRWGWNQINRNYCHGGKIDRARRKYGPENFKYEVLHKIESDDLDELVLKMNMWEKIFIAIFDTYKNGYNSTRGGDGTDHLKASVALKNHIISEETKIKISNAKRGCHPKYTQTDLERRAKRLCDLNRVIVYQYDMDGNFIRCWNTLKEAAEYYGISRTKISDCWTHNKHSAIGYIWKIDESTIKTQPKQCIKVAQYDLDGNKLHSFNSIREASEYLGKTYGDSNIIACCRNKAKTAYGYIWKYE